MSGAACCPCSVIITTYNDAHLLERAIRSVIKQDPPPAEIVIVDDGSQDAAAVEDAVDAASAGSSPPVVHLHRKANGGPSSARNAGLRLAGCEYVAFLDADDEMLPGCIATRHALLASLPESYFGVYGSAVLSTGRTLTFRDHDGVPRSGDIGRYGTGIPGGSCFYFFRKSPLLAIGGFDEALYNNEDFDLLLRLATAGRGCKGCAAPGTFVHVRADSLSRPQDAHNVFFRVSTFLDKAERHGYFTAAELGERRKHACLALARRIIRRDWHGGREALRVAFTHAGPRGPREWLALLVSKLPSGTPKRSLR